MHRVIKLVVDGVSIISAPESAVIDRTSACEGCCFIKDIDSEGIICSNYDETDDSELFRFGYGCNDNKCIFIKDTTAKKYIVDEVIDAVISNGYTIHKACHVSYLATVKCDVQKELDKKDNPEYKEFLRLQAIYGS